MKNKINKKGFTLVELLIVIAIIAIIITVVFATLNPLEKFAQARNTQRWVKISELLNSIHIYMAQNGGDMPNSSTWATSTTYMLGTDSSGCDNCAATSTASACLNLNDLITDKRIPEIPVDPSTGDDGNTSFYAFREDGGIVTIGACDPEDGEVIELTR
jgi:prepilin-type N-terminal cleavage/methylation domain-containing protein